MPDVLALLLVRVYVSCPVGPNFIIVGLGCEAAGLPALARVQPAIVPRQLPKAARVGLWACTYADEEANNESRVLFAPARPVSRKLRAGRRVYAPASKYSRDWDVAFLSLRVYGIALYPRVPFLILCFFPFSLFPLFLGR